MSLHRPFVEKLEFDLGREIPPEFRAWMLDDDSPYPVPSEINVPDSSPWSDRVERLFAAEEIFNTFVEDEELSKSGAHRFPRKMLVIGDNEDGGDFLLSLQENSWGAVYYMFHETAHIACDDIVGLHFLSHSFSEWIGSLVKLEGEDDFKEEEL